MKKLLSHLKFAYQYIVSSIGFYPMLLSLLFFGLALLMLYFESLGLSENLKENLSFLIITNGATARLILSSITTGIISLVVFSFTMVMLVLNQASANFTPRVIPGLISYKSNQIVLGFYLGTLIYTLVVMVNIRSDYFKISLPGFTIFLAMLFTILCLGLFVYFIHSIAESIQIESILENIHHTTCRQLLTEIKADKGPRVPNVFEQDNWEYLESPRTGYLQGLAIKPVLELCRQHDLVLDFEQPLGNFLIKGVPFARADKKPADMDAFVDRLLGFVHFSREERPGINYLFGFKHITESAVKALSPGINDPGTAIKAIDYLTDLFALRMELTDEKIHYDQNGTPRMRFRHETYANLYSLVLSPIRQYGKASTVVVLRLLYLLRSLLFKVAAYPHLKPVLYQEALLLLHDAGEEIENPGDRRKINRQLQDINQMGVLDKQLPLLQLLP